MPHAPGPWSADTCGWPIVINATTDDDADVVALLFSNSNHNALGRAAQFDEATAEANARLIAISPDALKLMEDLIALYDAECDLESIVNRAGVLIAKAKGEA